MLEDHAGELTRYDLVRQLNAIGNVNFSLQLPAPPGSHHRTCAEWLPALQQEATRLCQTCRAVASATFLEQPSIEEQYQTYLDRCRASDFRASGRFLCDLGGHALMAALSQHLSAQGAGSRFNQAALGEELVNTLARIYQPNNQFIPDDFVALGAVLAQYF